MDKYTDIQRHSQRDRDMETQRKRQRQIDRDKDTDMWRQTQRDRKTKTEAEGQRHRHRHRVTEIKTQIHRRQCKFCNNSIRFNDVLTTPAVLLCPYKWLFLSVCLSICPSLSELEKLVAVVAAIADILL